MDLRGPIFYYHADGNPGGRNEVSLLRRLRDVLRKLGSAGALPEGSGAAPDPREESGPPPPEAPKGILDQYHLQAPGPQSALDIFQGEWTSKLPGGLSDLRAGDLPLFEDPRIRWFAEQVGGVQGKSVLELGPLEGGHTYMLEGFGAASVLAVEANTRAYLKCLITKEVLGLQRSRFLCGDFVEYLRRAPERVDVCLASGVLYHMSNPAELIALMAKVTDRVCLWTQYYEAPGPETSASELKVSGSSPAEHEGFRHTLHRIEYEKGALDWDGFCGGAQPFRSLMSREEIIRCLEHFGLTDIRIGFDHPKHQHGPAFALTAIRA